VWRVGFTRADKFRRVEEEEENATFGGTTEEEEIVESGKWEELEVT